MTTARAVPGQSQHKRELHAQRGLARCADWTGSERPALADHVRETHADWSQRRGERLGFALGHDPEGEHQSSLRVEGCSQHRAKGVPLRLFSVDFRGTLRVRDAQALRRAMFEGVGHARAFGSGLLLLVRQAALG